MRYIIYGAGGIGGVVGGRLFKAGFDTVLICRGEHLQAIRERGLLLKDLEGSHQLAITAVGHPREITFTSEDAVILTMKSHDTEEALYELENAAGTDVPVICCQNGVANERMAARRFDRVYGMLVALPASFLEAGTVIGGGSPRVGVLHAGCFPGGVDDLITQVSADLTSAGFFSRPDPAVMRFKYAKLVRNLGNVIQVLSGDDRRAEGAKAFMRKLEQEAYECFAAAGIQCADNEEYRREVNNWYSERAEIVGAERGHNSTWQSLAKGRSRLELDYLNGEIVLLGKLHGVPTPYNALLRRLAQQLAASGGQPGAYTIAGIEAMVPRPAAAGSGA